MRWIEKTILITGGTGSLGSAFCEHYNEHPIITTDTNGYDPFDADDEYGFKKVIIFSRGWLKQNELKYKLNNPDNFRWFIGDIRDKERLVRAFKDIDIVIHTAAIKDLESCEYNPSEAMLTNVIGTQNIIDACIECKVEKSIFISTDKAVNPINTYGTSKSMAEKLWINANKYSANDNIKFSVCRYGNVIGSAGSVIPVFQKLINDGADELPITDVNMTRFFFTMHGAIQLIIDSIDKMQGGEIFIPKMASVRIVDICNAFEMPYKIVGIRQNEKLHEEIEVGISSKDNDWFLSVNEIKKIIGVD